MLLSIMFSRGTKETSRKEKKKESDRLQSIKTILFPVEKINNHHAAYIPEHKMLHHVFIQVHKFVIMT